MGTSYGVRGRRRGSKFEGIPEWLCLFHLDKLGHGSLARHVKLRARVVVPQGRGWD